MEPILNTRRSLLGLLESDIGRGSICDLFLQSCRLARHDGHLQVAWSYLSQAKALNVNQFEVEMEEARYLFQKVFLSILSLIFYFNAVLGGTEIPC